MKIATFNVNGVNGRLPVLLRWLEEAEPDVVCLQELKAPDERFPTAAIERAGYGAIWQGQARWNGVAILARGTEPVETRRGLPGDPDDVQSRYLEAAVDGVLIAGFYLPNGQEVFDTSGAISRLQFTPTATTGEVAEWREMASQAHRQSQAYENAAQEMLSWTKTDRNAFSSSSERSAGWDTGAGSSTNSIVEQFDRHTGSSTQSIDQRSSTGQSLSSSDAHDRTATTVDQVTGSVGVGLGGGKAGQKSELVGKITNVLPTISGRVEKTGQQQDSLRHGSGDTRTSDTSSSESSGVRDDHSSGSSASTSDGEYDRTGTFSRASTSSTSSLTREQALSRAKSFSETARRLEELSQSLSRDASFAESHGMALSTNLSQELAQWYRGQQVANPGLDAPEIWATDLSAHQNAVRQEMITRWLHQRQDGIRAEVEDRLVEPGLVAVAKPATATAADVQGSYHPVDVSPLPESPPKAAPSAAAEIIGEGRRALRDDRDVAQAGRNTSVGGSVDIQEEVHGDHNRGFFNNPALRQ